MSALMRSWMDAVVEEELTAAAECFKGKSLARGPVRNGHRLWDTHGLTIELRRARHLQVLGINENKNTCQAMVSDGTSLIAATFDRVATDSFQKLHGRAFKDCSRGAIISTKKYKLGSEGSPPFGKPKNILKQSDTQAVLSDMEGLFSPPSSVAPATQPTSPIQSQAKNDRSKSPVIATQAEFASQIPNLLPRKQTATIKSKVDSERRPSEKATLLSLLRPVPIRQDTLNARPVTSAPATKIARKESVLSEASPDKVLGMSSKLEAKANSQRTHISSSSQPAPSSNGNTFSPAPLDDKIDTGSHVASPLDSEKENSQESAKRGIGSATKPSTQPAGEPKQSTGTTSPMPPAIQFVDQFPDNNMFEGLKRVPRKYVRMSKAQQSLLERSDAWFDPNSDPKKSYALIPPKVYEDLTRFNNQKPILDSGNQSEQPESESDASGSDESETGSDSDIEGRKSHIEVELSDEEDEEQIPWSPTPERQLSMNTSLNNNSQKPSSPIDDEFGLAAGAIKEDAPPASLPSALRSGHEQNLSTRQMRRLPVIFSSSPTSEEELELDELHAVGDEVDDSLDAEQVPETSQGIPSTALQNERLVQVERTPDVRAYGHLHTRSSSNPVNMSRKRGRDSPTSSHLEETIPATCKEPTPGCSKTIPSSIESKSSISINGMRKSVPSQLSNPENVQNAALDEDQESDEDIMAQEQVYAELRNSQPRSSGIVISSPSKPSPVTSADKSNVTKTKVNPNSPHKHSFLKQSHQNTSSSPTTPSHSDERVFEEQQKMMRQNRELAMKRHKGEGLAKGAGGKELIRGRHEDMGSSSNRTNEIEVSVEGSARKERIRTNLGTVSSPDIKGKQKDVSSVQILEAQSTSHRKMSIVSPPSLKRNSDALGIKNQQQPLKRRSYSAAAAAIQSEEWSSRDTKAMIRATRNSLASHSSGGRVEDSTSFSKAPKSVEPTNLYSASGSPHLQRSTAQFSPPSISGAVHQDPPAGEQPPSNPKQLNPTSVDSRRGSGQSIPGGDRSYPAPKEVELDEVVPWNGNTNVYTLFKATYPNYPGSKGDFTWSLVYIEWLTKERDKLLPNSLFDDFIRVNVTEYKAYVHQPRPSNQKAITGYEFYNKFAKQGQFTKGLINYHNLQEALSSLDQNRVEKYRKDFNQPRESKLTALQDKRAVAHERTKQDHVEEIREVMVTESPTHQNVMSPELGTTKYLTGPRKKLFFETFSQMPSVNPKDASVVGSPLRESIDTPTKSKGSGRRRTLPWQQNASSPLSNQRPSSGIKRKRSPIPQEPTNHYKSLKTSAQARPTLHREASSPSPPNRHGHLRSSVNARSSSSRAEAPPSPVLASSSFQNPTSASTSTRKPTKRGPRPPSSPFHTHSLTALRSASSSTWPKELDEVNKVKGWLDMQPSSKRPVPRQEQSLSHEPTSPQKPSSHQTPKPSPRQKPTSHQNPKPKPKSTPLQQPPHPQQTNPTPHPQAQPKANPSPSTHQPNTTPSITTTTTTQQIQTPVTKSKSKSKFQAYLLNRSLSGTLTSRSNTPGSVAPRGSAHGSAGGKGPKKSMEYGEPMTQAWEFE